MDPSSVAALCAEIRKRQPPVTTEDRRAQAIAMAAKLRAFYHPKQRAFFRSKAKRRATKKTRRVGATVGGVRELLSRSIEMDGHRATYVTSTRIEARARAWESDTKSGFLDVLRQEGEQVERTTGVDAYMLGGIVVEVREAELALQFSNGSQISLFGADDERALRKQRGLAKHVYWVDEAQDFRFLDKFYKAVVSAALTDFDGEAWFTGTPGQDCAGMFYDITADDDERLPGWEVHEIAVVENPYFGRVVADDSTFYVVDNIAHRHGPYQDSTLAEAAAIEIRWENTAGKAIRENGWKPDDPDLLREWFAKWVKGDARFVYPVHVVPDHLLIYAPIRYVPNPFEGTDDRFDGHPQWYDHARSLLDLPRRGSGDYQWLFGLGADFGYFPDPFGVTLWAFNYEMPDLFEMFSWKHTKVLPDDQRQYIELVWNDVSNIVVFVGDGGNGKAAEFIEWERRFNLPMDPADKAGKNAQEELLAGDIRLARVHYRKGSPLLHEHRHLRYLPTRKGKTREVEKHRKLPDGTVPGDHLSDAFRYMHGDLQHHLYREKPKETRDPGTVKADKYEAELRAVHAAQKRIEIESDYGYDSEYGE